MLWLLIMSSPMTICCSHGFAHGQNFWPAIFAAWPLDLITKGSWAFHCTAFHSLTIWPHAHFDVDPMCSNSTPSLVYGILTAGKHKNFENWSSTWPITLKKFAEFRNYKINAPSYITHLPATRSVACQHFSNRVKKLILTFAKTYLVIAIVHWCLRAETHPCGKVVSAVILGNYRMEIPR